MRTYGTYRHVTAEESPLDIAFWIVTAEPHVMMKAKRVFPRVLQGATGALTIADTLDVCRDLAWLCDRYPLEPADESTALLLKQRDRAHREQAEKVLEILGGYQPPRDWREPAIPPREYQVTAAEMALATGRLLIADDLGTGKTFTGMLPLRNPAALPAVVVCDTHLPRQWQREIKKYLPWLTTHIVTSGRPYDPMDVLVGRGNARRPMYDRVPDVLIVPYSKLAGWGDFLAGKVNTIIFDEMQALRHNDTVRYSGAARAANGCWLTIGLTATPVYNYGDEMFNVMNIVAPGALGEKGEFKREWCNGGDRVTDPAALGSYLRDEGLMLRRTRAEIGRELPELIRIEQSVDSDPDVLTALMGNAVAMAKLILDKAQPGQQRFQAAGELDMRMRQATGIAKASFVAEFVRLLLETEEKVVVGCWHREVYRILLDKLAAFRPAMYTGSETGQEKERNLDRFISGDARVLFMSLRSGAGVDGLQGVCKVAVVAELDWSPKIHDQFIGRLHRDGQAEPVLAYFMVADEGSDPVIAEVLDVKLQQSEPIINPDQELFSAIPGADVDRAAMLAADVLRRHGIEVPTNTPNGLRR